MATWKSVVGYEGLYQVSSNGRVRRACPGKGTYKGRIVTGARMKSGYRTLRLYRGSHASGKTVYIHRLVFAAFYGEIPAHHDIHHKDGNRGNNKPRNLIPCLRREHLVGKHRLAGSRAAAAKLTPVDVAAIRKARTKGPTYAELAHLFHVGASTIARIIQGKRMPVSGLLSEKQVATIHLLYKPVTPIAVLARRYCVHESTIRKVASYHTHKPHACD